MNSNIAYQLVNKTTFLVGNKKNAGKTTFLNYALTQVRKIERPAFFTIGIDGESSDLVFDTPKPRISAAKGDYVVTSNMMINKSDASFEILHVFPYKTVLGRLVLAKAIRGGNVELVGSEDNKQLAEIVNYLREEQDIRTIIIDGAASRRTQVASVDHGHYFYIFQMDQKSINSDIDKLRSLSLINNFRPVEEIKDIKNKTVFKIEGAFTKSKLSQVPENCDVILIDDFTKVFLDFSVLKELKEKFDIVYKVSFKLLAFVVILKDIAKEEFRGILKKYNIENTIIFNPYEH
jgi:hypothetical protein